MTRFILFLILMTSQVFAQTECYFDNKFEDGTYGFFLAEKSITLMKPHSKYSDLERNGNELLIEGEVAGQLKMFFPRGIIAIGDELSSFSCTVWNHGGHGIN